MVILESQYPESLTQKTLRFSKKTFTYLALASGIAFTITPAIIAITQNQRPTGTYLNPLPETELAQSPTPVQQSPEQLIITAQAYLEKAIEISQKLPQTEQDHQNIITYLNAGLELANQAVDTSPSSPETYLIRARILASSSSIRPDATQLAQQDLQTAQSLSGGQQVSLPTKVNPIQYTPTEQASLAQNIIIASPEEAPTSTDSSTPTSNIQKQLATIPAGEKSTIIKNPNIDANSYIYLIPQSPNTNIFVQTKCCGTATISTTNISEQDLSFEYWIVNP